MQLMYTIQIIYRLPVFISIHHSRPGRYYNNSGCDRRKLYNGLLHTKNAFVEEKVVIPIDNITIFRKSKWDSSG